MSESRQIWSWILAKDSNELRFVREIGDSKVFTGGRYAVGVVVTRHRGEIKKSFPEGKRGVGNLCRARARSRCEGLDIGRIVIGLSRFVRLSEFFRGQNGGEGFSTSGVELVNARTTGVLVRDSSRGGRFEDGTTGSHLRTKGYPDRETTVRIALKHSSTISANVAVQQF